MTIAPLIPAPDRAIGDVRRPCREAGDLVSSIAIGFVFALAGYTAGFADAAAMAAAGTTLLAVRIGRERLT